MRERTTWNREEIVKKAALLKTADPYTMNQDHPQPAADKYVTGDPSTFAEDVHTPNTWESEYSGDEVKRNEIGMPEMRSDTFNHSEKTAKEVLLKKADLCVAVARLMLAGTKTASEKSIENQAFSLMFLPDQALIETHKRLAGEQQDEGDEDEDEGQEKQAQDQDSQEDKAEDKAQAKQAQGQQDQGSKEDKAEDQAQAKQAAKSEDQNDKANKNWPVEKTAALVKQVVASIQSGNFKVAQEQMQQLVQQQAQGQQVSQQQMQAQIQQMIQEAMGQMPQQQAPAQQAQQQMPMQQQSDEQTLDQMLAQDGCGPMAESDIQMETAPMDVGMDDLGPEDEALRTLFAQDDEQEVQQTQQKQANVRTASTRTVGTRPTAGVAKLGGGSQGGGASVADLSSMWQSAPDVRDAFGLK